SLPGKTKARKKMGLNVDYFTILAVGGSQGAKSLNDLVLGAWPEIDDGKIQIIHQVGERNYKEMLEKLSDSIKDRYNIYSTVDMPLATACADLVVCRSGASTLAEITAAGLPSLLVPYPHAYANHQKRNAEYIVNNHAGILCEEGIVTTQILADLIDILRNHPEKRKSFEEASKSLAVVDASKKVAEVVMGLGSA
ncbi:MAG: UDP-N-acetylglucosamine--N-acetylmuramyl-(pentapeptide) pyrophosphoryl-undecaprenol N-acetylglucosamine transferase, partial [Bacteroidales bacterium]|nr:UDP-N-acetylglucosamine--N-acetylmuramyl-(pentapeptide) pyrophosphoryl-undecaprenol N-acetylglucosamine transferase [Bacteroidales bacterium]